jgi:plasmid stabilization system protein ParE
MARVQITTRALADLERLLDFLYVAKYRWVPAEDVVLILTVRHQLEAGYREE